MEASDSSPERQAIRALMAAGKQFGATMKPHSQGQSPLATTLQSMLNPKGRGKGKARASGMKQEA